MKIIDDIPGDKSVSHRAVIIGSLVEGTSIFNGFLTSDDCLATVSIFRELGVDIELNETTLVIKGQGVRGLTEPKTMLNVGNSGTGIRLISGVLCGLPFKSVITGDASIQNRPMKRIIAPLTAMGATIESVGDLPPLTIYGQSNLTSGWHYDMPVASAQVKSSILLAAVSAGVRVSVKEPDACRDHTERMLRLFGADVISDNGTIQLVTPQLHAIDNQIQIPGDISSALFFMCLALMINRPMEFKNIGLNPSRTACLDILRLMGATIDVKEYATAFEPMGDIVVRPCNQLKNIHIPPELVPNVIDELPILALLATKAAGKMVVREAKELRVKESDRISGIHRLMTALGGDVVEYEDGFDIQGTLHVAKKCSFDAHFDHRLAMSALIAGKAFGVEIDVTGVGSISTSFPNFISLLNGIDPI